eukprot:NODE_212_length_14557_cov_0.357103.p5 type:complete len:243 gc:universal NODE_212_length_14557_cov_0.357103:5511-6239(+)
MNAISDYPLMKQHIKCFLSTRSNQKFDLHELLKNEAYNSIKNNPKGLDQNQLITSLVQMEGVKAQMEGAKAQKWNSYAVFSQAVAIFLIGGIVWHLQSVHEKQLWEEKRSFKMLEWLRDVGTGEKHSIHSESSVKLYDFKNKYSEKAKMQFEKGVLESRKGEFDKEWTLVNQSRSKVKDYKREKEILDVMVESETSKGSLSQQYWGHVKDDMNRRVALINENLKVFLDPKCSDPHSDLLLFR